MIVVSRNPNPWFLTAAKDRLQRLPPILVLQDLEEFKNYITLESRKNLTRCDCLTTRVILNVETETEVSQWVWTCRTLY